MKQLTMLLLLVLHAVSSQAQVVVTVAGRGGRHDDGEGVPATSAALGEPVAIAFDKKGNLYIGGEVSARLRQVDTFGIIRTIAGNGIYGYCCDGGPATDARISAVYSIVTDTTGVIYFSCPSDGVIRKVTTDGIIHTVAGTGTLGYNGDNIPATDAQLNRVNGIALDDSGNIYVCDRMNYRLRKIDKSSGLIHTIAGTGVAGYTPDGAIADTSKLEEPFAILIDRDGNLILKDKHRIRKIDQATGLMSTLAGDGSYTCTGDGGPATNAAVSTNGMVLDSVGNLILAEGGEGIRIRRITSDGMINAIVGTGEWGNSPNGTAASSAKMASPTSVAFNQKGELYYSDKSNCLVRKITNNWVGIEDVNTSTGRMRVYPNPSKGHIKVYIKGIEDMARAEVVDVNGRVVHRCSVPSNVASQITLPTKVKGVYVLQVRVDGATMSETIIIE